MLILSFKITNLCNINVTIKEHEKLIRIFADEANQKSIEIIHLFI
jgi:hypothetical protein